MAHGLRAEDVLTASGEVVRDRRRRSTPICQPASSRCSSPKPRCSQMPRRRPFEIEGFSGEVGEDARLRHRYLDLRREPMQRALALRHRVDGLDAELPRRARASRDRDPGADPLDPRGRPRLPRPQPPPAGLLLRPAAVTAALQAAADGRRVRALLPDRPLLPRRGPARRPPARLHPIGSRDVIRRGRGRDRPQRAPDRPRARRDGGSRSLRRSPGSPTTRRSRASARTGPTPASGSRSPTSPTCSSGTEFNAFGAVIGSGGVVRGLNAGRGTSRGLSSTG